MTRPPYASIICVIVAAALAACSGQPLSPAAPTTLDSAGAASSAVGGGPAAGTGRITTSDAPASAPSAANFEIKFMTDMIDHHHMAIMMAELCIAKAIHPELRSLCENIKAAQMAEIETMQSWLQEWYAVSHAPVMKPGDQRMMDRLAALSGAEFEIAFMEMMITHHEKAIKEGQHCLRKAEHPDLRSLCTNIIATQSAEIDHMQAWLCEWYGECRD